MKRTLSLAVSLLMCMQLLFSSITVFAQDTPDEEAYTAPESPAVTYNMNVDWKFRKATSGALALADAAAAIKDGAGRNFYDADYDDSDWETVSVPHPINAEDSFDGTIANSGEGGIYRGFMFYRKHITVPKADAGKKLFLEFESVRNSIYLYVNGQMAGYYEASITASGYDITDYLIPGQDNIIAIATDNATSRGRTDFTTTETINDGTHTPGDLSGSGYQWNTNEFNETQGGITGNVNLYAKPAIYQTLPLYNNLKTTGNYIYASDFDLRDVNNSKATINVKAEIRNETDADKALTLQVDVVRMDGTLAGSFTADGTAAKASDRGARYQSVVPEDAYAASPAATNAETVDVSYITASAAMENLRLWSPDDPYLYTVYTILKDGDTVIDVQSKETGFRQVVYDYNGTDGGFKINGKQTYLKGYAQRSMNEWAVIGVANDWLTDYDMSLVKESNSNFIRWMHVAPKPAAIRSTDKYGIVSVCPAGDKESDVSGRQWDQRMEAMRDAIIYYRNSPSVIFYEAGNGDISAEHMQEMTDIKNSLDPEGFRFMGCRTISSVEQVKAAEYVGTMLFRNAGPAQNSMKEAGKYIPIMETEYSRGESPRRVWDDFSPYFAPNYTGETLYDYVNKYTTGSAGQSVDGLDTWDLTQEDFVRTNIADYTSFYNARNGGPGSVYTDSKGTAYSVNQYAASALMIWADSNQHGRMTVSENCRTSGKVDAARIKKEAFYSMQAAQSDEPAVHIVGHWNYPEKTDDNYWYYEKKDNGADFYENGEKKQRDPSKKTVYVIGSGDVSKVELYINGVLQDTCTKPDSSYIYSFPNTDVTQSGAVSAKAYNARDEVIAEDEIKTAGEAEKIRLTPITGPEGFLADGSDIMYFDVEVVDKDGNVCPLSYDKISLKLSGEGTLMGGYNSGANANTYNHESEQSIYAECGLNRVFVRSTRNAGAITLSASLEGNAPTEATVSSTAVELEGGLTTHAQQSLAADEKPAVIQQTVPALQTLGKAFEADFSENGNTEIVSDEEIEKDIYEVRVNGSEVSFTDSAYSAGGAIWVEAEPVLSALKSAGANIDYTYDASAKTLTVSSEGIVIEAIVDDPDLLVTKNGSTERVGPMNGAPVISDNGIFVMEMSTLLAQLQITSSADSANKVYSITYTAPDKCVKITANYDDDGRLISVNTEDADIADAVPSLDGKTKIMYWRSLVSMEPVSAGAELAAAAGEYGEDTPEYEDVSEETAELFNDEEPEPVAWEAKDVTDYDTLIAEHSCESSALEALTGDQIPVTIEEGAPDGTHYIKTGSFGNEKYGQYCFQDEFSYGSNTKEDIMFTLDIRFDAEGSGFTPRDNKDSKAAGTVMLRNGTIQVQKGSGANDYVDSGIAADTSSWYRIALVGRFSAADANVDMYVWQYGDSMEYLGKMNAIPLRTLGASQNNGASHLNVSANTSVDNMRVYKLGADTLRIASDSSSVKAGESMLFSYSATRANEYITAPSVNWDVYDEAGAAPLGDENITIGADGLLVIGGNAQSQIITVRASAQIKEDAEIYASKKISVSAVDTSSDTYDTAELTASGDTVRVGEPLTITAKTYLNGAEVTPGEGDLIWKVYNEGNLRELGNRNITVENGVLSVTEDAVPQTVTVKAVNKSGSVSGAYKVRVLPAGMNYGNEDKYSDTFVASYACEEYGDASLTLTEGSWDGSGFYETGADYNFAGFPSNTNADVLYAADMKFANDGAGWTVYSNDGGKLGLQLSSSGTSLNALGASNKTVGSLTIDKDAWYNVQVMCATGNGGDSYAVCSVYKYDENGRRVNPQTGEENSPYALTVSLRNLSESQANHIRILKGTYVDNIMYAYVAPDKLTLALDASTVLAGGSAQASTTASRKGIDFPTLSNALIQYDIYDSDNKYPLGDDKITINSEGKISVDAMAAAQDIYVRVSSVSGGISDAKKLTIKSSDIFEITKAGFSEDYSVLKRLTVTKNFNYDDDATFIAAVYGADGAMKSVAVRKNYGSQYNIGENYVTVNMEMPADFDPNTDTLRAFVVTKLSVTEAVEADGTLAAEMNADGAAITAVPNFDENTDVALLVLTGDPTNVSETNIAYFIQDKADALPSRIKLDSGEYTMEIAGKIGGVHNVKAQTIK